MLLPTAMPQRTLGRGPVHPKLRTLDRFDDAIHAFCRAAPLGLPAPILFVALVLLCNLGLNLATGLAVAADDREQLAFAGHWALGYSGVQPPLHTWIVRAISLVVGEHLAAIYLARFGVLFLVFGATWHVARLLRLSREGASAAMFGLFLLPQIGWEAQRSFSHSLTAMLGCLVSFAILARIVDDGPASRDVTTGRGQAMLYVALGLACAAALLGKYNSGLFLAGNGIALALRPAVARRLSPRGLALSLAVALIVLAAPALWALDHADLLDDSAGKFAFGAHGSFLADRAAGLLDFVVQTVLYVAPLPAVALLALRGRQRERPARRPLPAFRDIPALAIVATLSIAAVAVAVSGTTQVKIYWLHPALLLSPLALALFLSERDPTGSRLRAIAAAGLFVGPLTIVLFAGRLLGVGD